MTTPHEQPEQQPEHPTPSTPAPALSDALRQLGEQIEETARTVLSSERTREIQASVAAGLNEVTANLQKALESLKTNPQVQDLTDRAQKGLTEAQQSSFFKDLQETLAKALSHASTQLSEFSERIKTEHAPAPDHDTPQNIPIEHDTSPPDADGDAGGAATGPTVRLDP
jgi:flagellar hook-basal body complex protein FliE